MSPAFPCVFDPNESRFSEGDATLVCNCFYNDTRNEKTLLAFKKSKA